MRVDVRPMPPTLDGDLRTRLEALSFPTIGHFLEEGFATPEIRPMLRPAKVVGTAVTVRIAAPDSVLVHKATELLRPGDALVVDIGGDTRHAPVGEMVALAAKARGAAAIVVDGVCTDVAEIEEMRMPVFARGTSLLTTKLHGLRTGAINAPITCGGAPVNPGDAVLADDNGVLVLPPEVALRVAELVEESDAGELSLRERVLGGESLPELSGASRILECLDVREDGRARR
jgi:regulator of RNase E activity RraA